MVLATFRLPPTPAKAPKSFCYNPTLIHPTKTSAYRCKNARYRRAIPLGIAGRSHVILLHSAVQWENGMSLGESIAVGFAAASVVVLSVTLYMLRKVYNVVRKEKQ